MMELLSALCAPAGVSGDEGAAAQVCVGLLKDLGDVWLTRLGSVVCRVTAAREDAPRVILTAHLDRVGLMVTRITEEGFLRVAGCGGVDCRSLWGARVTVHTAGGPLPGVVCATPPHLQDGKALLPKADEATVDVGLSHGQVKGRVEYGDRITLDGPPIRLLGDRICAAGLDDRVGCAAVIGAARLLKDCTGVQLFVVLTTREEVGSQGGSTAAFSLSPDVVIGVDASMAVTPDDRPERCGVMGKGPMIGFSPLLDRALSRQLTELARREGIPWQPEVMAGPTGTDVDAMAVAGAGARAALVSIPLRGMHTPSEIIARSDLEHTVRLLAGLIGGAEVHDALID